MFNSFPNLQQLYILGNPDPSIDYILCHKIMVEAVKRNIKVCISTSGIGGEKILKSLFDGISPTMVDYISFSIDSIIPEKMNILKGIKYPWEKSLKGIKWAVNNGYVVKIQPTLWSCNYLEAKDIIEYFTKMGINWFSFHIGSLESGVCLQTHQHLTKGQIDNVMLQIEETVKTHNNLKVRCPIIYSDENYDKDEKWYCMHPKTDVELLVTFTQAGIKFTNCPLASSFDDEYTCILGKQLATVKTFEDDNLNCCPFSKQLCGNEYSICRYISKTWGY